MWILYSKKGGLVTSSSRTSQKCHFCRDGPALQGSLKERPPAAADRGPICYNGAGTAFLSPAGQWLPSLWDCCLRQRFLLHIFK